MASVEKDMVKPIFEDKLTGEEIQVLKMMRHHVYYRLSYQDKQSCYRIEHVEFLKHYQVRKPKYRRDVPK